VAHQRLDPVGSGDRILVLPNDHQMPSSLGDRPRVALIALDIARKLRAPIVRVRTRRDAVNRASVPEAAKTLNYNSLPRKDDVRTKPQARHQRLVLAEAQPTAVQLAPQCHLVSRVRRAVAAHNGAHGRG
jgi:hypothetical protein